jgi:hypothetical protein
MSSWKGIVGKPFTAAQFEKYVLSLKFGLWRPQFVVLHNTGIPTLKQWHDVSGEKRMKGLEGYYRGMGWSGGPHLFVADDYIWAFTPLTVPGVHSPSWNSVSWGVEMVGDFDKERFGWKTENLVLSALATLHIAAGLDSSSLRFHREDPKTTHKGCPGKAVVKTDIVQGLHDEIVLHTDGEHKTDRLGP